jgi:hypothetical protein
MKYFILRGYLPQYAKGAPFIGGRTPASRTERQALQTSRDNVLPPEGEYPILRIPRVGRASVFVSDVFDTLLLVAAPSQEKAYSIATPLRGYLTVFLGAHPPDGLFEGLIELEGKPDPTHTRSQIAATYRQLYDIPSDTSLLSVEIGSGTGLLWEQLEQASVFVRTVHPSPQLSLALLHLERSHLLFAGFMSPSYYHFHYRHERVEETPYARRKKYLEERTRFDLAFLSAFRSIEALLGAPVLKRHTIPKLLQIHDATFGTSLSTATWHSYHEVFTTRRKKWGIAQLLCYYLDVRNAVAAHGNSPSPYRLAEDQVFEIQRIAEHLLYETAFPDTSEEDA